MRLHHGLYFPLLFIVVIITLLPLAGCGDDHQPGAADSHLVSEANAGPVRNGSAPPAQPPAKHQPLPPAAPPAAAAAAASGPHPLEFQTTLFVQNDVEVKSRLTGIIDEIFVQRGSAVNKGTPLARLRDDDLSLEVKKADVYQKQCQADFARVERLHAQKLISDSEYDAKKMEYERAQTEYQIARVNYDKSFLRAPFSGVVVEVYARLGQRVVEDDSVPLFRVTAMEPLLARIFVPQEQLSRIRAGAEAEFIPSAGSAAAAAAEAATFPARVQWISPVIDPGSGMANVIVALAPGHRKGVLKPGTGGTVRIIGGREAVAG